MSSLFTRAMDYLAHKGIRDTLSHAKTSIRLRTNAWKIYKSVTSESFRREHPEYSKEIEHILKTGHVEFFPYDFPKKYADLSYKVMRGYNNLPYVPFGNRKLYLSADYANLRDEDVSISFTGPDIEQDPESPHKYFSDDFKVEKNDIFLDVGSAEGKEALDIADVPKKMYLFEGDKGYSDTLRLTFEDDINNGKAVVYNKFVSARHQGEQFVRIDDVVEPCESICLKMDVEGSEFDVLESAERLLRESQKVKLTIACYHYGTLAQELKEYLEKRGFTCTFTEGYVLYLYDRQLYKSIFASMKNQYPYFRKAVIRAVKNQ